MWVRYQHKRGDDSQWCNPGSHLRWCLSKGCWGWWGGSLIQTLAWTFVPINMWTIWRIFYTSSIQPSKKKKKIKKKISCHLDLLYSSHKRQLIPLLGGLVNNNSNNKTNKKLQPRMNDKPRQRYEHKRVSYVTLLCNISDKYAQQELWQSEWVKKEHMVILHSGLC